MNTKSYIYILSIIILTSIFIYYVFSNQKYIVLNSGIEKDILISNNTWETGFNDNVAFRKGDEIEYNIILKPNSPKRTSIDIRKLSEIIDIKKIIQDDIEIESLDNLDIEKTTNIKIIGDAKDRGNLDKDIEKTRFISVEDIDLKKEDNKNTTNEDLEDMQDVNQEIIEEENEINDFYIEFEKNIINSNINNLIKIKSNKINDIKFINIGGVSLTPIIHEGESYISIDRGTFDSGNYFVIIQKESGEIITTQNQITFEYNQNNVNIANITPNSIQNDIDRYIVIQGNGFDRTISLQLSNNVILRNTTFDVINDNVMSVKIPSGIEPGEYYINIMKPDGIHEITNKTFLITN